jgi:glutathione S-transferase
MQYLASRCPSTLWPDDPHRRLDISRWQFWEAAHWGPTVGTFLFENMVKQIVGAGAPDPAKLKEGQVQMDRFGPVLNEHLATRNWLVGDTMTLADISVGSSLAYAQACKLPLEPYAHIRDWHQRLEQVDAMKKTAPRAPN